MKDWLLYGRLFGRNRTNGVTIRRAGDLADALPCGCIPYEHEHYGPCDPTDSAAPGSDAPTGVGGHDEEVEDMRGTNWQ